MSIWIYCSQDIGWGSAGILTFDIGAHAEVGSSKAIFSLLATLVVKLMILGSDELVSQNVESIILEELASTNRSSI